MEGTPSEYFRNDLFRVISGGLSRLRYSQQYTISRPCRGRSTSDTGDLNRGGIRGDDCFICTILFWHFHFLSLRIIPLAFEDQGVST